MGSGLPLLCLLVFFFFESTIYHLEITLTWSPLCYGKEEVLVIQCDNNRGNTQSFIMK